MVWMKNTESSNEGKIKYCTNYFQWLEKSSYRFILGGKLPHKNPQTDLSSADDNYLYSMAQGYFALVQTAIFIIYYKLLHNETEN